MAVKSRASQLLVEDETIEAFARNIEQFSATLSPSEQAILSELMRSAMDPWSRSMLEPPELTEDESRTVERLVKGRDGVE